MLAAVLEHYRGVQREYARFVGPEFAPEIDGVDELRYLIADPGVTVHPPRADGRCAVGIIFRCCWEQEHALGVRLVDGRVEEIGWAEVADEDVPPGPA